MFPAFTFGQASPAPTRSSPLGSRMRRRRSGAMCEMRWPSSIRNSPPPSASTVTVSDRPGFRARRSEIADRVQAPLLWHTLERVHAAILEGDSGAGDEIPDSARHEDLARRRLRLRCVRRCGRRFRRACRRRVRIRPCGRPPGHRAGDRVSRCESHPRSGSRAPGRRRSRRVRRRPYLLPARDSV